MLHTVCSQLRQERRPTTIGRLLQVILRLPRLGLAGHGIDDKHVCALEPNRENFTVEFLTRSAHERAPAIGLLIAWAFSG